MTAPPWEPWEDARIIAQRAAGVPRKGISVPGRSANAVESRIGRLLQTGALPQKQFNPHAVAVAQQTKQAKILAATGCPSWEHYQRLRNRGFTRRALIAHFVKNRVAPGRSATPQRPSRHGAAAERHR